MRADPNRTGRPYQRLRAAVLATHPNCWRCGKPIDMTLSGMHPWGPTLEHTIPYSTSGRTRPDELAASHRTCNLRAGNRTTTTPTRSQAW